MKKFLKDFLIKYISQVILALVFAALVIIKTLLPDNVKSSWDLSAIGRYFVLFYLAFFVFIISPIMAILRWLIERFVFHKINFLLKVISLLISSSLCAGIIFIVDPTDGTGVVLIVSSLVFAPILILLEKFIGNRFFYKNTITENDMKSKEQK